MAYTDKADDIIAFLNECLELDCEAMSKLIAYRVPCSESMANHESIQVGLTGGDAHVTVSMLGILNGYAGAVHGGDKDGWGLITAEVEDNGIISRFLRTDHASYPST